MTDPARDLETRELRQAHVEEEEVRPELVGEREGGLAVHRFADDLDPGRGGEVLAQVLAGGRLVLGDERPHAPRAHATSGMASSGISRRTQKPPAAGVS